MNKIKNKLIFGTANLGMRYGINASNISKYSSLKKIFSLLKKEKIFFIDTAYKYKNAQKHLSKQNIRKFNIISKLPNLKKRNLEDLKEEIVNHVEQSLRKLNISRFYALLIHDTRELNGNKGKRIFKILQQLKKRNIVKKIGYSIYCTSELDKFYFKFKPDIVQGPLNILDQRIIHSGWLKKLNKSGIEFHARSIFLQGLLLNKSSKLPVKFKKYSDIFINYHQWLKKNNLNSFKACLYFISSIKFVKKIVVGVDNYLQLQDIMNLKLDKKKYNFKQLSCFNKNLIDPRNW